MVVGNACTHVSSHVGGWVCSERVCQAPRHPPEPVKAMPMMSRPARMAGVPCIWMGVGFLMPLVSSTRRMAGGNCRWGMCMGGSVSHPSVCCEAPNLAVVVRRAQPCGLFISAHLHVWEVWDGGRQVVALADDVILVAHLLLGGDGERKHC